MTWKCKNCGKTFKRCSKELISGNNGNKDAFGFPLNFSVKHKECMNSECDWVEEKYDYMPDWLRKAFEDRDNGNNRIIPMNESARIQEERRLGILPPSKATNIIEALQEIKEEKEKRKETK